MTRLLHRTVYLVRGAVRGLRASPVTTGVAVATIAITLTLVGTFALVIANMNVLLEQVGRELHLTAYLEPGLDEAARRELALRVSALPGVESVEIVSEDEALRRFAERMGGTGLLAGLDANPLPASLEVRLAGDHRTAAAVRRVAEALAALPGVEELGAGQQWVEGYARARGLVRGVALGLGGVLALATLLIVANTIRLTVYARRDELEILGLVGASRTYLRLPFLLEGALQGLAGGLLALALLWAGFHVMVPALGDALRLFLGWSEPVFLSGRQAAALVAGGAALGVVGAAAALAGERLP